tara:strand:+ start:5435 stop:5692 length:258 start_codon:yes stop_codon:yes gene_type:complete
MPPKKKVPSVKNLKDDEHHLRIFINGATVEIISPIPRDKFLQEMVNDINENSMKEQYTGWYSLRSAQGGVLSIRVRCVDAIEEVN